MDNVPTPTQPSQFKFPPAIRVLLLVFVGLVMGYVLFYSQSCAHNVDNAQTIHITDDGFLPTQIDVTEGDTVVFENTGKDDHWPASDPHPTHTNYPEFDAGRPLLPGNTWEFTFVRIGEWGYHDHNNPTLTGKVIVRAEGSSATTDTQPAKPCTAQKSLFERILQLFTQQKTAQSNSNIQSQTPVTADAQLISTEQPFIAPQPYEINKLVTDLPYKCEGTDSLCAKTYIRDITRTYGPGGGLEMLRYLYDHGLLKSTVNDHQLAHEIGRQTAESQGANSQAFLLCTSDFNMGCQHGFFEYILARSKSTTAAAGVICQSTINMSVSFQFQCYHGVGHGVLMAAAYDVTKALATCNEFSDNFQREGCWQGVFMEGTNSAVSGYAQKAADYTEKDPLSPCNKIDLKYQPQCYLNHGGWLMNVFQNNITLAAQECMKAANPGFTEFCAQGLGILTSTPSWQFSILGIDDFPHNTEHTIEICHRFPTSLQGNCLLSGMDNMFNFDELHMEKRALPLCALEQDWPKVDCYHHLGVNISRFSSDNAQKEQLCRQVPTQYYDDCHKGAFQF